jgi:DNA-binding NarL/FixJ family response regulator
MARDHRPRLRVAVASEQSLVGDSVQAALDERGLETVRVAWPSPLRPGRPTRPTPGARPVDAAPSLDVGLLLSELDSPLALEQARAVLRRAPARWLVLTGAPRGSAWGAVLDAGAHEVVPSELTLDEIEEALRRIAEPGADDDVELAATDPLVRQWVVARESEAVGADRLASLTPREREVLEHLHRGSGVTTIACDLGITPATVRSQVKAILRKLQVNSQLAAVAAYAEQVTPAR